MAKQWNSGKAVINHVKKATSQGVGGRGRSVKCSMSHMNSIKNVHIKSIEGKVGSGRQTDKHNRGKF